MIYFILPFILLIYFELLGRWLFSKINEKPLPLSFPVGFIAYIALLYLVGWPISAFNGSFYIYLALVIFITLAGFVLIIKDRRLLSKALPLKHIVLFLILLIASIAVSLTRTLGDPHGYDVLYYLNMISFNIGNKAMNTLHPHFGTYPNTDIQWITYVFQS